MSNISNYESFEKEAGIKIPVVKTIGRTIKNTGRTIFETPQDAKYASKNFQRTFQNQD